MLTAKQWKEMYRLVAVLLVLLVAVGLQKFFSKSNQQNQQLLFSLADLSQWQKVSLPSLSLDVSSHDQVRVVGIAVASQSGQWDKIVSDLQQIFIEEKTDNVAPSLEQQLQQSENVLEIELKNGEHIKFTIAPLQENTGNFWIKKQTANQISYLLCSSDISFDGFYQTPLEGKKISYWRWLDYLQAPWKSWIGINFWSRLDKLSMQANGVNLFSIDTHTWQLTPASEADTEYQPQLIREYVDRLRFWLPAKWKTVDVALKTQLQQEDNLVLEIQEQGQAQHLVLSSAGLWWQEKDWLFPMEPALKQALLVLRESFLQKKIISVEKWRQKLLAGKAATLHWDQKVIKTDDLQQPSWANFLCLLSGCLADQVPVFMKVDNLTLEQRKQFQKMAQHILILGDQSYYLFSDTYRLQVLSPLGSKFTFIAKLDHFYPELR